MRYIRLFIYFLIVNAIFSCSFSDDSTIRIGYLPISSNLPLFAAVKNGYFKKYGLVPDLIPFQTSNALTEALTAGNIDFEAGSSTFVTITAAQAATDRLHILLGVIVSPEHPISALLVSYHSPIKSIEELRGKKIGCFPGAAIKQFTRLFLTKHNSYDENTTLIELPPQLQLQALENGSIDALFTLEPTPTIGISKNIARTLISAPFETDVINPWVGGVYSTSRSYETQHKKTVRNFTDAMRDAIDFIDRNPESAKFSMLNFTPIKDSAIIVKLPIPQFIMSEQLAVTNFQKLADILLHQGILRQRVDVKNMLE